MLRLQAAKLPAMVLASMSRLHNELSRKEQKLCVRSAAKLFCRDRAMLPFGQAALSALKRSTQKVCAFSFTSVGLCSQKLQRFPLGNRLQNG